MRRVFAVSMGGHRFICNLNMATELKTEARMGQARWQDPNMPGCRSTWHDVNPFCKLLKVGQRWMFIDSVSTLQPPPAFFTNSLCETVVKVDYVAHLCAGSRLCLGFWF